MQASIRTVKDRFSEFVRRARLGEEIVLTSRDRPVAKLVPISPEEAAGSVSREALLEELGELRASLGAGPAGAPLSQTVIDLRREGRY